MAQPVVASGMMTIWRGCLVWILAQVLVWGGVGAKLSSPLGSYRFRDFGVDEGLTNLAVIALAQDQQGYIWVGTEDGLFRYDGRRFTKFGPAEGLPSSSIRFIKVSSDGWLWVDTEQGLARGRNGRFEPTRTGTKGSPDLPRQALATDARGGVWAGDSSGLWFTRGTEPFRPVAEYPGGAVEALWVDEAGQQIGVARRGSLDFRDRDGKWTHAELPAAFQKDYIHGLLRDRLGRVWVRTLTWLLRYPDLSSAPENLTAALKARASQWGDLVPDGPDRVLASTSRGVACFEAGGAWLLGEERGLGFTTVNAVLVDREGSLWVGSEGLHRLAGRMAWSSSGRRNGLPHDTVWCLRRTRRGELFAATQQGLALAKGSRWTTIPHGEERTFYALAEDGRGGILAGGTRPKNNPLNTLLYQRGSSFQEIPLEGVITAVSSMAWAPDDTLWVGTVTQGLHRFHLEGGRFRGGPVELPGGSNKDNIHQVILDGDGNPVVSGVHGLSIWDGQAWQRLKKAQGLLDDHPGTLALGPDGSLYLNYWEVHGLTRLHRSGRSWSVAEHLTDPPELLTDAIYSLAVSPSGTLWIGTALGIRRWDGHRLEHFTHHNGLPGDDTSGNGLWIDAGGDVWCGMTAGATHFEATRDRGPSPAPRARLEDFRNGVDQHLPLGPSASVPFRARTVSFVFTADSFLQEAGLRPQVRLVGFEDAWRDSEIFQARYTGLPAGDYRFEVRFQTREGIQGPTSTQAFRILPPWWQRWWAYLAELFVLTGLVGLTVRWRTQWIRRRVVALEALVHERTWNLEQANQALEEASMVDPLTGLKNRRFLSLSLPEEVARVMRGCHSEGAPASAVELAFLIIDLDHFKTVNDTFGHAAGDAVLHQAGAILRSACRESDTVVRWGGEEFLVVAKATEPKSIEIIAQHILDEFRSHSFLLEDGQTLQKTCSIGYSAFPVLREIPEAFRWEDTVEVADQCLYAAKKSGRDGFVGVWAPSPAEALRIQKDLLHDLPGLVADGLLALRSSFPKDSPLIWK